MLETIRDERLPDRKRSSSPPRRRSTTRAPRAVRQHGLFFPNDAADRQLRRGDMDGHCPIGDAVASTRSHAGRAPIGGETVYAIPRRIRNGWSCPGAGRPASRPSRCATPAPTARANHLQSLHRRDRDLLHAPAQQSAAGSLRRRPADARLLLRRRHRRARTFVATERRADGGVFNVGSGRGHIRARLARDDRHRSSTSTIEPLSPGEFRPGEIRSLISDITRARAIGYEPSVTIEQGIAALH